MSDLEQRLRETEAMNLLTNRILMDFLSLEIDRGATSLENVKKLVEFSAREVLRGAPSYEKEVNFFANVLSDRFNQTFPSKTK
jgi:hypothetical protein